MSLELMKLVGQTILVARVREAVQRGQIAVVAGEAGVDEATIARLKSARSLPEFYTAAEACRSERDSAPPDSTESYQRPEIDLRLPANVSV